MITTTALNTSATNLALLDDDPSVAARGVARAAGNYALLSVKRRWAHDGGPGALWALECGARLSTVEVAYETWGALNATADNAVLVCHALTGDSHAAGRYSHSDERLGWWDPLIGPGRAFDTDRYFVVCANILGGCQGTTGPASLDPATGRHYGGSFPQVTVRDMVRLQYALLRALGVRKLAAVVGGSLGGMQVLEWLVTYPDFVSSAIPIGASLAHTAQGIAYNLIGREAIIRDPAWQGGDYYGTGHEPDCGLALARMIGMITYQSEESMQRKFSRHRLPPEDEAREGRASPSLWRETHFQVEGYLHYQGDSLVKRFDANSYLVLTRAMDLHDVGWGRGGLDGALSRVSPSTRTLVIGISSDILFPTHLQKDTVARLRALGRKACYREINSPWGHDAFLIEYEQLTNMIAAFLADGDGAQVVR